MDADLEHWFDQRFASFTDPAEAYAWELGWYKCDRTEIPQSQLRQMTIEALLVFLKMAPSKSEARRLLTSGAVKMDTGIFAGRQPIDHTFQPASLCSEIPQRAWRFVRGKGSLVRLLVVWSDPAWREQLWLDHLETLPDVELTDAELAQEKQRFFQIT